jgi:hypothetical protein
MARKPRVDTNPVANAYSSDSERVIEFVSNSPDHTNIGGLVSFRRNDDGTLHVHVYALDAGVTITVAATKTLHSN